MTNEKVGSSWFPELDTCLIPTTYHGSPGYSTKLTTISPANHRRCRYSLLTPTHRESRRKVANYSHATWGHLPKKIVKSSWSRDSFISRSCANIWVRDDYNAAVEMVSVRIFLAIYANMVGGQLIKGSRTFKPQNLPIVKGMWPWRYTWDCSLDVKFEWWHMTKICFLWLRVPSWNERPKLKYLVCHCQPLEAKLIEWILFGLCVLTWSIE